MKTTELSIKMKIFKVLLPSVVIYTFFWILFTTTGKSTDVWFGITAGTLAAMLILGLISYD